MHKMWKRFLAVSLCVLLLLSAPMGANIFDGFTLTAGAVGYSGTCGENLTWTLDSDTGIFSITGTGEMEDYNTFFDVPWHSCNYLMREVRIADGVTSIGNSSFSDSSSLTSVNIPNSVTSIGDRAFSGCRCLTSVNIPDSVTSIGIYAFSLCKSLTSMNITDSVTCIERNAFSYCTSLTNVTVGNSVTSIGNMAFNGCTSLTSVNIPDSVTSIGNYAFALCTSLTIVTIPDSVKSIGSYAFEQVGTVHYAGSASGSPWGAKSAKGYVAGKFLVYSDESKTNLVHCSSAATGNVIIPESVTSIGDNAFRNCSSLKYIHISDSVTEIGSSILDGTSAYICSDTEECYAKKYAEVNGIKFRVCEGHVPAHDHDYVSTSTPPTCAEQGYTTHTCTICGDTYTDSVVDALGHSYKSVVTAPTCTEQGYTTHTCTVCGDSYRDSFVDPLPAIFIRNYKGETTVDYRTTVTFAAEVSEPIDGAEIHWFVDGKDAGIGESYTVKEAKKDVNVQARYMEGTTVLAESEIETVKVKSGFFDKLKAFFRALFRRLPVLTQEYLGIERITTR